MFSIKTILFPTDHSDYANRCFPYAAALAKAFQARLIVLHLTGYGETADAVSAFNATAKAEFDGQVEMENVRMRGESPHKYILEKARERACDLIVMATHGRSALAQFFLGGSLAEEVVRYSRIPVFVVKVEASEPAATYTGRLQEILFTTDLSEASEASFVYAAHFARTFDAKLFVLHVIDEEGVAFYQRAGIDDDGRLGERVQEFVKMHIASLPGAEAVTEVHIREGHAETEIVKFAEAQGIDLIAIATHGHTGLREDLLGSTTDRVIRQAHCPVLAIRS